MVQESSCSFLTAEKVPYSKTNSVLTFEGNATQHMREPLPLYALEAVGKRVSGQDRQNSTRKQYTIKLKDRKGKRSMLSISFIPVENRKLKVVLGKVQQTSRHSHRTDFYLSEYVLMHAKGFRSSVCCIKFAPKLSQTWKTKLLILSRRNTLRWNSSSQCTLNFLLHCFAAKEQRDSFYKSWYISWLYIFQTFSRE